MQRLFFDSALWRADLLPCLSFGLCQKVASALSDALTMSEIPLPLFFFFLLAAEHRESFAFKSGWTKCEFSQIHGKALWLCWIRRMSVKMKTHLYVRGVEKWRGS